MNNIVKQFIESNINLIEEQQWEQLFNIWYDDYSNWYDKDEDAQLLKELFKTFYDADILIYEESEQARKNIITNDFKDYIDGRIKNKRDPFVERKHAYNHLKSHLGFNESALSSLFDEACMQLNLITSEFGVFIA